MDTTRRSLASALLPLGLALVLGLLGAASGQVNQPNHQANQVNQQVNQQPNQVNQQVNQPVSPQRELVSQQCLGCICEASTKCDLNKDCSSGYCGPFLIGQAYFVDSELTAEPAFNKQTLQTCATDPYCAAAVIRKYMAKYPRDCNGDGRQTCTDFAMIHKAGPGGCERNAPHVREGEYWKRLTACLAAHPNA